MAPLRVGIRRPEPPVVAGISLITTGLVAAIVLGNTLGTPAGAGAPGSVASPGRPTSSGVAGVTPSSSPPATVSPTSTAPSGSPAGPGATATGSPDPVNWRPLAWSPDGRYLAVAQDVDGTVDLGLLVPGVSSEPVTLVRGVVESSVQWSADSSHLATMESGAAPTEIVVVTVSGNAARVEPVAEDADPSCAPAWTPEGLVAYCVAGGVPRLVAPP